MSKVTQNYEQLAIALGLQFDAARNVIYGQRNGYEIVAYATNYASYPYMFTVCLSAKSSAGILSKQDCKQFTKEEKSAATLSQKANQIIMVLKNMKKQEKLRENFDSTLNSLIAFLRSKGFEPCCQFCGQQTETKAFEVAGDYMHLCPECAGRLRQNISLAAQQKQQKNENIVGGVVGALLGSVIGIVSIIIFSQLGYISILSGIIMAVCTLKGYELLGGKLTKKGAVISGILILLMTYVGDRMDWAIMIARELETDFFEGFRAVPYLLEIEVIESSSYWYNLILLYIFTALGGFSTMYTMLKERKKEGKMSQIGTTTNMY